MTELPKRASFSRRDADRCQDGSATHVTQGQICSGPGESFFAKFLPETSAT